jgi:hypothetical protein
MPADIYVDGDACPVREEIYRVAARLTLDVFVVSNGSRPIRPQGTSNVGGEEPAEHNVLAPVSPSTNSICQLVTHRLTLSMARPS